LTLPAGTITVSGNVNDPQTGNPRTGVEVIVTVTSGGASYQASTTSNSSGDYTFTTVPSGTGTVEVVFEGNIASQTLDTSSGTDVTNVDLTPPSATYAAERFIITLTWAATPTDLDSHLYVPDGTPFHVYYITKGDNTGPLDAAPFAGLDLDDTSGFGPETITIKINNNSAYYSGNYRYWVYNYSSSPYLNTSIARVTVYQDGTVVKNYIVPTTGTTERFWHVFDLNGTTITDVNTLQTSAPSPP